MGYADSSASPWFASSTINSSEARYALAAAFAKSPSSTFGCEAGVIPAGSDPFSLGATGSGAAPVVVVFPGQCVINNAVGGTYICTLPSAVDVAITTPLPTGGNTRKDLLCARVLDSEAGDGGGLTGRVRFELVTGTSAATPTVPATPSGWLPLYVITVNSSGGWVYGDVRTYTRGVGGVRFVRDGDTRDGSHAGDLRVFATGKIDAWLSNSWLTIVAPSVWTQVNVNYNYAGGPGRAAGAVIFGAGGSSYVRYKRTGNDLTVSYQATWGTSGDGGAGDITTTLPNGWSTPNGRKQWLTCELYAHTPDFSWSGDFVGQAYVAPGSNIVRPYFMTNVGDVPTSMLPYRIAANVGVAGNSIPNVGAGRFAQNGSLNVYGTIELAS